MKDGRLIIDNEAVVSQDEEALQHALADHLCSSNATRVLEIGYGLGLAHHRLQAMHPAEHWVVEGNEWLAKSCVEAMRSYHETVPVVIFDTWEHALEALPSGYFDSILFDPYPFDEEAKKLSAWSEKFHYVSTRAARSLFRNLKPNGRLGIINFDPAKCDKSWMRDQFLGLFELQLAIRPEAEVRDEEAWVLKKLGGTESGTLNYGDTSVRT